MEFILFLLIAFLVYYIIIRPLFKVVLVYRKIKKNIFGSAQQFNRRQPAEEAKPKARKIFDKSVGEYTTFEEISETSAAYSETIPDGGTRAVVENQTIDVEWEDI